MITSPVIGLTTYGLNPKRAYYLPGYFVDCIRRAGGIPVLIPPGENRLDELVETLDGLLFAGGGDINPKLYGGKNHESVYGVDNDRDLAEMKLARIALDNHIPTLAICRGMQVFTIVMGGSLIEDISLQKSKGTIHRLPEFKPVSHSVNIEKTSRLHTILDTSKTEIASIHHQAVANLPPGTKAVAFAPDGLIEAIESDKYRSLTAVQWHPEITAADDPIQQKLFDALVQKARQNQIKRSKQCV
jgi:putative glutamine amidotransferase